MAVAVPSRISYAPTAPNDRPPNAGSRLVMSSRVTRDCASGTDADSSGAGSPAPWHPLSPIPSTTVNK